MIFNRKKVARRGLIGLIGALFVLAGCSQEPAPEAGADEGPQDWRATLTSVEIGITGFESASERMGQLDSLAEYLSEKLGVPVAFRQASDYAAVTQALAAGQIEIAATGASNYANMYETTNGGVEPLVVNSEIDGALGYFSALFVRADSSYQKLEDLEGKTIAHPDTNSTSGYLYPRFEMRQRGINPDTFFSRAGFAGGHAQAVISVVQGQYDSGVTWVSGQGKVEEGYSRGNLRIMVDAGQLDIKDIRVIELFGPIPNGPWVARKDLPAEFKAELIAIMETLHVDQPVLYEAVSSGGGQGYKAVEHSFFEKIIALRAEERAARRAQ